MRTVDLALYADMLAARSTTLAARLERARDALRQAAIEREARRSLAPITVERLERVGALSAFDVRAQRAEIAALTADLSAVEELQAWVEARLFEAREDVPDAGSDEPDDDPVGAVPPRETARSDAS